VTDLLTFSPEVASALADKKPVLAFESTIISHGMPYPRNAETAREAERIARTAGAVPATIAVLDGRIVVGLTEPQLERLATEKDVLKVSRRDMAWALAARRMGATTVSATMLAARLAGISVFATGGIGGVHMGVEDTFDISADLTELASTSVMVVSAGAKAILDLPRTLEVLETLGVPVVGFGASEFPAFYSRSSGLNLSLRVDTPAEAASLLQAQRALGLPQGILVANPVPQEWEIPRKTMERWIDQALQDLSTRGVTGKAVTPFLLSRIVELSGGKSLETNVKLFHNNVRLGSAIAVELSRMP
jgi:pseudouridine-5'-phosphate glycosidase